MSTIVVGVDGSDDAGAAAAWAGRIAGQLGATVIAVHAIGLLEYERDDPDSRHLVAAVQQWTTALDTLPPDHIRRRLVPGPPVQTILDVANDARADLVVVGTRGMGARPGTSLGSTSIELAERCPFPLVIVPAVSRADR